MPRNLWSVASLMAGTKPIVTGSKVKAAPRRRRGHLSPHRLHEHRRPQNQPPARAIAKSRLASVGVVLLLIYTISGFLFAPWLIRQQLPSLIDKQLGAQGAVSAVRINPFLLTFEASDLTITEKNGTPALQVGRIFIDFEASSLLRRTHGPSARSRSTARSSMPNLMPKKV